MAASATAAFERLFSPSIPAFGPTIPKCSHGVYDPHNGGRKAEYCPFCTPKGPKATRNLVLPRSSDAPLTLPASRANQTVDGACPGCGSRIHTEESEKVWTCAECGEKYPAARKRS